MVAVVVAFLSYRLLTTSRQGVVTGILYPVENPSALIEGDLVKEGDTLRGITVVKIHRTEVEFEKNGKRWKQRVGERPNPAWKEDEDAR
jgi:hypothetical protein